MGHHCGPLTGGVRGSDGCGGARELEFEEGKRKEFTLCSGEEEADRGDIGDGDGRSFPFPAIPGYEGTGVRWAVWLRSHRPHLAVPISPALT